MNISVSKPTLVNLATTIMISLFLTACGGASSNSGGGNELTAKETAIEKISNFALDSTKPTPTIEDYNAAGVTGVTAENLDELNTLVESLNEEDVDTEAELEALLVRIKTPVANDGSADIAEDTPSPVTLSAIDTDGDTLTFIKVINPTHGTVSIAGNTATYIPVSNYNGSDSFTFKANDGNADSNIATINIEVIAVNDTPTANAGVDASMNEGQAQLLNGTGSDVDTGDTLTYSWSPTTNLSDANIAQPTFTAPADSGNSTQTYTLTVSDGTASATDTVIITTLDVNHAPTANAGVDVSVNEGQSQLLNGTGSDIDTGDTLTYSWSPTTNLSDANIAQPTFTAPADSGNSTQTYILTVSDGSATATDTVSITTLDVNHAPTANAGLDVSVNEGQTQVLNGTGSDVDTGDILTYSWSPTTNLSNANIAQPTFTAPAVSGNSPQTYTLTVSDGTASATDTVSITTLNLPAQPKNVQASAGNAQVTLSWDTVAMTSYDICQATETITNPTNCAIHAGGTLLLDSTSPQLINALANDIAYFFVVIPKYVNGAGDVSAVVTATPAGVILPTPTGKLNDTGITLCGDYAYAGNGSRSNSENCANTVDAEGDPIPAGQDGHFGRDANSSTNTDSDGHAGFNFTKIDSTGVALANQTATYATTPWNCVKDNVTGLIWEVKTSDDGLHDKNDRYSWYINTVTNGGSAGHANSSGPLCEGYDSNVSSSYCNTQAYVTRVNVASWCGANNWRMPTREELRSITDRGTFQPSIDASYFPNTIPTYFWTSTPNATNSGNAWIFNFIVGYGEASIKSNGLRVRLVRSGQ